MANLKNKNKKNVLKTLKLSRKQKFKRNPIPWAVLLLVSLIFTGVWVVPNGLSWFEKKSEISQFESEINEIDVLTENQKKARISELDKFNNKAKETLVQESQRFPKSVDTSKIAKILEIYALQLNLDRASNVELKTVSFANVRPSQEVDAFELPTTITLVADEVSLKRFINFLQTGEYSRLLVSETISAENKGETAALDFLNANLLPWLHINSINLSEDGGASESFVGTIYNVQMQVSFFSQSQ